MKPFNNNKLLLDNNSKANKFINKKLDQTIYQQSYNNDDIFYNFKK
jgi:hypothetical protein